MRILIGRDGFRKEVPLSFITVDVECKEYLLSNKKKRKYIYTYVNREFVGV